MERNVIYYHNISLHFILAADKVFIDSTTKGLYNQAYEHIALNMKKMQPERNVLKKYHISLESGIVVGGVYF